MVRGAAAPPSRSPPQPPSSDARRRRAPGDTDRLEPTVIPNAPAATTASTLAFGEDRPRIESLLSARLFMAPQLAGDRLYFLSNLGGRLGLYAMDRGGSVPEPLLPSNIALHNPHMLGGLAFRAFPALDTVLVMIDRDGDEIYQPMSIPLCGGLPRPAFGERLAGRRVHLSHADPEDPVLYLSAQRLDAPVHETWRAHLDTGELTLLHEGPWGSYVAAVESGHDRLAMVEGYSMGDTVLYLWRDGARHRLLGTPFAARDPGQDTPLLGLSSAAFTPEGGLLVRTAWYDDRGTLAYLDPGVLDAPHEEAPGDADPTAQGLEPVAVVGVAHEGLGVLEGAAHLEGERYLLGYNIDGVSWLYEGRLDEEGRIMALERALVGEGALAGGVIEHHQWQRRGDEHVLSFSTATTPTQIYTLEGKQRTPVRHTRERLLGLPDAWLSAGEEASFTSFDGLRVSARLYRPSPELGYVGPRPLVYYVHGGPQGQERPDFAWFSIPLIQFLTLRGFAVFVPNARGSSGYGLSYTKRVDRDWGGDDRLDHVHAMTRVLSQDPEIDTSRAAVIGRSYGGYMTLTLAARHPELWAAACDMFGPYDLLSFSERIPETWKPYFKVALGDPDVQAERDFLTRRSPRSHIDGLRCPLLVIQGANDPRVVEAESADLVARLREDGKHVDYLVFEDEGHDVLKHDNRVRCYDAITDFFVEHLRP